MKVREHPLLGITFMLLAASCFVVLDTSVKLLSLSIPVLIAVWFRYLCQAIGMTMVVLPLRGRGLWRTRSPWLHVLRGCLMLVSSALSFMGLQYMPVSDLTAVYMLTPLVVTLIAVLFMGERVNGLRWLLVAGGFSGAMLVIQPGNSDMGWAVLLPVSGMLLYSVFQILTSRMARTEDPMVLHMTSGWVGALLMTAVLPWVWQAIPSAHLWRVLLLAGLMGTVGHFLLILAYTRAKAGTLAPYMYLQIPIAMLAGWWMFGQVPDALECLGMVLIVACGASAAWLAARPLPLAQQAG